MGFIMLTKATYFNFIASLKELNAKTIPFRIPLASLAIMGLLNEWGHPSVPYLRSVRTSSVQTSRV